MELVPCIDYEKWRDVTMEVTSAIQLHPSREIMVQLWHGGLQIAVFGFESKAGGGIMCPSNYKIEKASETYDCGYWLKVYKRT